MRAIHDSRPVGFRSDATDGIRSAGYRLPIKICCQGKYDPQEAKPFLAFKVPVTRNYFLSRPVKDAARQVSVRAREQT